MAAAAATTATTSAAAASSPVGGANSNVPTLPSYYGPRSFQIPSSSEVTSSLLQQQSAQARARLLLARQREAQEAVGKLGQGYARAKEARVRARMDRLKATSVFASASSKIQATAAESFAQAALGNDANKQMSYFSGDHLTTPSVDENGYVIEPVSDDHHFTTQRGRARSSTSRRSGASSSLHQHHQQHHQQQHQQPKRDIKSSASGGVAVPSPPMRNQRAPWDRSPPRVKDLNDLYRETAHAFSTEFAPLPGNKARSERLAKKVMERSMALRGGGGAMDREEDAMREEEDAVADYEAQYGNMGSSLDGGVGQQTQQPQDPRFQHSLKTYTQQWWVRLHNSENKDNTSPYYIGNKSVYYPQEDAKRRLLQQQQDEHKETLSSLGPHSTHAPPHNQHHPAILPPLHFNGIPHEDQQNSASPVPSSSQPPLKKFIVSSNLDPAIPKTSNYPHSARVSTAPVNLAAGSTSIPVTAAVSSAAFRSSTARLMGSGHGGGHGKQLLSAQSEARYLNGRERDNLPESWSHHDRVIAWKRAASSMTLTDPPAPPTAASGISPASSQLLRTITAAGRGAFETNAPSDKLLNEYEKELLALAKIKKDNERRGTKFQYDQVSELHGFLSQKNIKQLLKQTNYNRRELYVIYVRFKALCALSPTPNGIDKETFKKGVARLAVEDDRFVNRVFSLVDDDQSNEIEWEEFLTAMSALEKGDMEAKVRFFFQVYDLDADGYISRQDLSTMFHSSSMLDDDDTTAEVVSTFVNRVFKQFGQEASGKISFDDVMQYMKKVGNREDVWDVFGRSMLHDFSRPKH